MPYRIHDLMITVIPDSLGFDIFHDPHEEPRNGANGRPAGLAASPPPGPDSPVTSPPPNGPDSPVTSPPPNGPDGLSSPPPTDPDPFSPPPDPPEQLSRQQPVEAMELRMLLQFALAQLGGPLSTEEMRPRTVGELDALEGRLAGALEEVRGLRARFAS